ncbi:hypothetical protein llg_13400 [Luteolibacter sp. LG18]|nr:hypothetical protein llg_13400 [Luteolibacter sp. LG18]
MGLMALVGGWATTRGQTAYLSFRSSSGVKIWFSSGKALGFARVDVKSRAAWCASMGGVSTINGPCGSIDFDPGTVCLAAMLPPPGERMASGWHGGIPFEAEQAESNGIIRLPYAWLMLGYTGLWLGFCGWWQARKRRWVRSMAGA